MANRNITINDLLESESRTQLYEQLLSLKNTLTPSNVNSVIDHAQSFGEPGYAMRIGIIHTYTSELLEPWLEMMAALQDMSLQVYHAPYGLAVQEANPESALVSFQPDITLLLLQQEDIHPNLNRPLSDLSEAELEELLVQATDRVTSILQLFRSQITGHLLVTLLPRLMRPGLGIYDPQAIHSESNWWSRFRRMICEHCREHLDSSLFLDIGEIMSTVGRANFFSPKYWYSSKYPFSPEASLELASRIIDIAVVLKKPKAKVIVLDADNTLWGGVIGEEGINGIALGPDYPGNAFVDFQRKILEFQKRGFVLVLCSKNNPEDLFEVLDKHPHQILKRDHFVAYRINWNPKPDNIRSLAEELNLGLDSFVFVDDSDYECAAVRYALPEVEVVQTPRKPVDVPFCLDRVSRLEVLSVTSEDLAKTRMYQEQNKRETLRHQFSDQGSGTENYLKSLEMHLSISLNDQSSISRLAQLTQKTNQFNLTTRRYSENEITEFVESEDHLVAQFSLQDIYGDSGVVGLAIISLSDTPYAIIDTFLMSCRVIGREVEGAFLESLLSVLADLGIKSVSGCYLPTSKNILVANFYQDNGFSYTSDGNWHRDIQESPAKPRNDLFKAITIQR